MLVALLDFAWVLGPIVAAEPPGSRPLERVMFRDGKGTSRDLLGTVLTQAADGGLLLIGQDGRLWTIEPPQLDSRADQQSEFEPLRLDQQGLALKAELGERFEIVTTKHYVVATSAGKPYAAWCASLFERLYSAFQNYWKQRGMDLDEPEFPLIAIVLKNEREFATFATRDAGADAATAKGYYSVEHNRIVLYDLTATGNGPATTATEISRRLGANPFNIATVVHEATHQIAFNSGLHTRLADNPLWVTEGMAMFFETPDLTSRTGWRTVGQINDLRQKQFQEYLAKRRKPDSLSTLIASDARFTDAELAGDAYAEAWALTYYLAKSKKEAYAGYLRELSQKPRLVWDKPSDRVSQFQQALGNDLRTIDADFVRYMRKLK